MALLWFSGGRAMNLDDLQRLDELRRYHLF